MPLPRDPKLEYAYERLNDKWNKSKMLVNLEEARARRKSLCIRQKESLVEGATETDTDDVK